jgi:hypothetical protein
MTLESLRSDGRRRRGGRQQQNTCAKNEKICYGRTSPCVEDEAPPGKFVLWCVSDKLLTSEKLDRVGRDLASHHHPLHLLERPLLAGRQRPERLRGCGLERVRTARPRLGRTTGVRQDPLGGARAYSAEKPTLADQTADTLPAERSPRKKPK